METPKEKLKKMAAWDVEPLLSETEIDELLEQTARVDKAGNAPTSEDWTPTYDLDSAASAGWLIKAGRAASTTETDPDSLNVTSRIFANCMRMARTYSGKRAGSVRVN